MAKPSLSVSLVTFRPDLPLLQRVLEQLIQAFAQAHHHGELKRAQLVIVDNGPGDGWRPRLAEQLATLERRCGLVWEVKLLSGHGNVGYGRGHNLALAQTQSDYHLILNPDVLIHQNALLCALAFLRQHPEAGLVAPKSWAGDGAPLFLCRRYPSVWVLLLRGFAPPWLRRPWAEALARYEMRDRLNGAVQWDVPLVSGCFMLVRSALLKGVGGFCPRYFLYFEDYDLSLRLAAQTRLVYLPTAEIVHLGGHAARKGWRHRYYFARSALRFFVRHGWRRGDRVEEGDG